MSCNGGQIKQWIDAALVVEEPCDTDVLNWQWTSRASKWRRAALEGLETK